MSRLVVTEFVTLDGVMEAPGGEPTHPHTGWVMDFVGEEQMEFKLQETLEAGSHLIGRVTYESFAGAWPERTGEFADKMNSMPKHVVTTTLDELEWNNSTPIKADVPGEVAKLKQQDGDPIVLGSGKRLFPDSPDKTPLTLVDTKAFATGVQVNTYHPAEASHTG